MSIFSLIIMILSQFINVLHVKQKSLPSKEDFYFLYYFSKSNSWKTSLAIESKDSAKVIELTNISEHPNILFII